jgi:hypothetical protein
MTTTDTLYLGLKLYEWLTLVGILIGPIAAVAITLWVEGRRRDRDQQVQLMRMLLSTRHLPGDAAYTVAINMIPVEFNKCPKIITAWNAYIEAVRYRAAPENEHAQFKDTLAKQTKLIFEVMSYLGFQLAETDIQNSAYAAGGFIERDNITLDAWRAWPRIAEALELNNKLFLGQVTPDMKDGDK